MMDRTLDARTSSLSDKAETLIELTHAMSETSIEAVTIAACVLAGIFADTIRREIPGSLDHVLADLPNTIKGSVELTWAARDAREATKQ